MSEERIVIEPSDRRIGPSIREVLAYRDLLFFLLWRDVKVRYKQTLLGIVWILAQPLAAVTIYYLVFHKLARIPSDQVPYPLFVLCGVLLWNYFSGAMNRATTSLVMSGHLLTKVYFPRLLIPLSAVLAGLVDLGISSVLIATMLLYYQMPPDVSVLAAPFFLILAMLVALGAGLWLSALNVQYRDVGHVTPFLTQFWMFLTPVIYPTKLIPESLQWVYGLNPMVGVIEGFRWAILGTPLLVGPVVASVAAALLLCVSGLVFFGSMERTFADVV